MGEDSYKGEIELVTKLRKSGYYNNMRIIDQKKEVGVGGVV
jgi:hypothetical protein